MNINSNNYNYPYKPAFTSNARSYRTEDGNYVNTMTFLFRDGFNWTEFTDYIVRHFRNKEKANIVQFASSDGAEAYSLIISLLEKYPKEAAKFLPIQAYDLDSEVVEKAQSGYINLTQEDMEKLKCKVRNKDDYFKLSDKKLYFNNDDMNPESTHYSPEYDKKTYKADKKLTDNVKFNNADMYDILNKLEDNSDTILMCRNVLGYFDNNKTCRFIDLVSRKLKRGSIFTIGAFDCDNHRTLDEYIQHKGFIQIMPYVYEKI